jgi:hypothetical protein
MLTNAGNFYFPKWTIGYFLFFQNPLPACVLEKIFHNKKFWHPVWLMVQDE